MACEWAIGGVAPSGAKAPFVICCVRGTTQVVPFKTRSYRDGSIDTFGSESSDLGEAGVAALVFAAGGF